MVLICIFLKVWHCKKLKNNCFSIYLKSRFLYLASDMFCFNFSPEKVVYNVSVLPNNKYRDQKNCGNFKNKIVILILLQITLKLKLEHQTVEPDPFKIKFRFRFGFSNFFYGFSSGSGSANFIFRVPVPV